jgi:hypothetical protein
VSETVGFILSGLSMITCILFVVLKFLGIISFGWIWVFVPVWGMLVVMIAIYLVFCLFNFFAELIMELLDMFGL